MNGMPIHNPLTAAAKDSIAMSKETGDKNFKLLAMVMMGVSGVAAILHAVHVIYRDMAPGRGRDQRRDDGPPERPASPHPQEPAEPTQAEREPNWVHKAGVAGRAVGPKAWTEHAGRHGFVRQR